MPEFDLRPRRDPYAVYASVKEEYRFEARRNRSTWRGSGTAQIWVYLAASVARRPAQCACEVVVAQLVEPRGQREVVRLVDAPAALPARVRFFGGLFFRVWGVPFLARRNEIDPDQIVRSRLALPVGEVHAVARPVPSAH